MGNRLDLNEAQLREVCSILEQLIDGTQDGLHQRILLLRFFGILQSGAGKGSEASLSRLSQPVTTALQYMDDHIREELDVQQLAMVCNVSVNTLERQFKSHLGVTPFEMLRKKRLFESMMYLKSGSSVTEAAMNSGFSDCSYFIMRFRKRFGITPSQYQKGIL